jgi:hypothetical protein
MVRRATVSASVRGGLFETVRCDLIDIEQHTLIAFQTPIAALPQRRIITSGYYSTQRMPGRHARKLLFAWDLNAFASWSMRDALRKIHAFSVVNRGWKPNTAWFLGIILRLPDSGTA